MLAGRRRRERARARGERPSLRHALLARPPAATILCSGTDVPRVGPASESTALLGAVVATTWQFFTVDRLAGQVGGAGCWEAAEKLQRIRLEALQHWNVECQLKAWTVDEVAGHRRETHLRKQRDSCSPGPVTGGRHARHPAHPSPPFCRLCSQLLLPYIGWTSFAS